ncbi:hypothetical protein FE257_006454 [Aspergillus nanangensis]|uniref:Uncharacterized protein n=1 Tax=Aspergillus nanangensis TaxID=2582783 RepID=A0AAD4GY62_ASPNN|nr:hypothetical protein FE257_006454 [Aspergillus nanangensis]
MSYLPNELILEVIEALIPPRSSRIYSPEHPVTRTLVSLTLTSKLTHQAARRLLLTFCLHINSSKKLDNLLDVNVDTTSESNPPIQPRSLFLAPFPSYNIAEPHIVRQVDRLFSQASASLRTLVINIPLRSLYPNEDDQGLRKIVRGAFCRLTALEEFCSAQDELYCDALTTGDEPAVWTLWPRLKKLALYNACLDPSFVQGLQGCPNLTHVVFTRADCVLESLPENVTSTLPWPSLKRVIIVNTHEDHTREVRRREAGWETSFVGWLSRGQRTTPPEDHDYQNLEPLVSLITVPIPVGKEGNDIEVCQEWVCSHALDGSLWDFPNDLLGSYGLW